VRMTINHPLPQQQQLQAGSQSRSNNTMAVFQVGAQGPGQNIAGGELAPANPSEN
jgi:hypothetical protein